MARKPRCRQGNRWRRRFSGMQARRASAIMWRSWASRGREEMRAEGFEPSRALHSTDFRTVHGFRRPAVAFGSTSAGLRSGLSLHRAQDLISGVRCCPSSLYTFPAGVLRPGLARDCHVKGFPEFGQFCITGFPASTQVLTQVRCVCHSATPASLMHLMAAKRNLQSKGVRRQA